MTDHAISALERKRAELLGDLERLERQRRALLLGIRHVDGALDVLGYSGDPADIPARGRRHRQFRRGELQRMVAAILRDARRFWRRRKGGSAEPLSSNPVILLTGLSVLYRLKQGFTSSDAMIF